MSSEVNPQPSSPLQSAGVVLSNERIKRGISIQEVADQIGKRMHDVGDQTLRMSDDADHRLRGDQEDIDQDTDPGAALGQGMSFRVVEGNFMGRFRVSSHLSWTFQVDHPAF